MRDPLPNGTVRATDLWLRYPLYGLPQLSFRGLLAERLRARGAIPGQAASVLALKRVGFEAEHGDRIAVVGLNGAGKSTLLRVISGIYAPSRGELTLAGSVVPMLGALPAYSPDATGYENIKLSAYAFGLSRAKLPEIIADVEGFSELDDALELPLKTYSAGMVARFYFSILTSLSADIFVMDEFAFSAGDASFKEKAKQRSQQLLDRARTVFLASHDLEIVRNMSNKAIYLIQGELAAFGDTESVLREYKSDVAKNLSAN